MVSRNKMAIQNPKLGKLRQRSEFLHVRGGKYQARPGIVIQMRKDPGEMRKEHEQVRESPQPSEIIKVGFTATKKIGNAVVRNKCKRRMRQLARALLPLHGKPGFNYVFIARADTAKAGWAQLHKDVEKALLRLA